MDPCLRADVSYFLCTCWASIWARKTCVPLWLLFWSCLQDYTKWNWQDNNELFCLYLCVCVYISQKNWQKFFKCKSLKDSKRQDLKRLDWCLSFQIVVPIASTKNGSNVLRLKYLRCSVSWVFKWAWAHMGSSALPGWPHYQRYSAFCPVLREVSEPRMTAMARTFAPCKGIRIPESGIFCSWNPESWALESGIQH